MATAVVIDVDGSAVRYELPGDTIGLEFLHQHIGHPVDLVQVTSGLDMWCHDEGIIRALPVNRTASVLLRAFGAQQPFRGLVIFTGGSDAKGQTLGLDDAQAAMLIQVAADISLSDA